MFSDHSFIHVEVVFVFSDNSFIHVEVVFVWVHVSLMRRCFESSGRLHV